MKNLEKNIADAQKKYPELYHVVSSNEVHSFETIEEAITDLNDAIDAEEKIGSGFTPALFPPNAASIVLKRGHHV